MFIKLDGIFPDPMRSTLQIPFSFNCSRPISPTSLRKTVIKNRDQQAEEFFIIIINLWILK
jgi:hypothetical protein